MPRADLDDLIARDVTIYRDADVDVVLCGSGVVRELKFVWRGRIDEAARRSAEARLLPVALERVAEYLERPVRRVWVAVV